MEFINSILPEWYQPTNHEIRIILTGMVLGFFLGFAFFYKEERKDD